MTDRQFLQNAVRRWRLNFQPWQVRFGRWQLLDLMQWLIDHRATNFHVFRQWTNCNSLEQAHQEARAIVDDELRRIARLPSGPPAGPYPVKPMPGQPAAAKKEQTK